MEKIDKFLKGRGEKGLFRRLYPADSRRGGKIVIGGKEYIDFCSNDYLGLSEHPKLKEASIKAAEESGVGAGASRLLSGSLALHQKLEERVAAFKNKEVALVFNSGYQANIGIISSLCSREDAVFSDKLNHASITDGIIQSGAKSFRFRHNDTEHLEALLKEKRKNFNRGLIITETVFSMDGDKAPLEELAALKKRYDCMLMVDEAHATGVFGKNGSGLVEEKNAASDIDIIMGTFSKALGSFGAYAACSGKLRDYLINTCRAFIYSTALPPTVIAANLASLDVVRDEPFRRTELIENSDYLRTLFSQKRFETKGSSQIVPLIVGNNSKTVKLCEILRLEGYWVLPIRPPTVPEGASRIRFSITCFHKKEMLEKLVKTIAASNVI